MKQNWKIIFASFIINQNLILHIILGWPAVTTEGVVFFTRNLRAYQNSGGFKFHILECISFFTRILGAYQNSGVFKFHILECISFFTRILGTYQNSGVFKFHTGMYIDKYIHATKYPWIVGFLKLISIRILGYLSSFGYFDNWIFQLF